jgi:GTP-binding protein HflX
MSDFGPTARPAERSILVAVSTPGAGRARTEEYLEELALLASSAGALVVGRLVQERRSPDPALYIGKGKVEELAWLAVEREAQLVIVDDELSPVQVRNLERNLTCKIIDRSALILDIFASRARSSEAKAQVELAQLQYMLPRLTRQWTHLSKQYGGIGTKGPGETQIETDRRVIRTKIGRLRERLARIGKEREVQRKGRSTMPRVALVGYTNAGKSTLLNWFSDAGVVAEDRLFATLDPTVRAVRLSPAHSILLADTVGFIRKLPHHLIASFKSTLDEVREADLLLHVVDVSHPAFNEQIAVVQDTLQELGAGSKPAITVFNKIDALVDRSMLPRLAAGHPGAVFISAARGINTPALAARMGEHLEGAMTEQTVRFRTSDYDLLAKLHGMAEVLDITYDPDAIVVRCRLRRTDAARLQRALALRRI